MVWKPKTFAIESIDESQRNLDNIVCQVVMTRRIQRSLNGYRGVRPLIVAGFTSILALNLAGSAYLPTVGPAPLRFRPAFKTITNSVVPALPVVAKAAPPPPPEKVVKIAEPAPPPPVTVSPPKAVQNDGAAEPHPSDSVISAQMLLKYFSRATNGASAGVIAPPDFTPPRAPEPPSSTADYSTPSP